MVESILLTNCANVRHLGNEILSNTVPIDSPPAFFSQ